LKVVLDVSRVRLDYNGDGLSDILLQNKGAGNGAYLLTSTGAGFTLANVTNSWGMTGVLGTHDLSLAPCLAFVVRGTHNLIDVSLEARHAFCHGTLGPWEFGGHIT